MDYVDSDPQNNRLLAALPMQDCRDWMALLEAVDMPVGQVLYEPGVALEYVYFPTSAIVSLLYVMENGASAEIAMVGNEGIVGMPMALGIGVSEVLFPSRSSSRWSRSNSRADR